MRHADSGRAGPAYHRPLITPDGWTAVKQFIKGCTPHIRIRREQDTTLWTPRQRDNVIIMMMMKTIMIMLMMTMMMMKTIMIMVVMMMIMLGFFHSVCLSQLSAFRPDEGGGGGGGG